MPTTSSTTYVHCPLHSHTFQTKLKIPAASHATTDTPELPELLQPALSHLETSGSNISHHHVEFAPVSGAPAILLVRAVTVGDVVAGVTLVLKVRSMEGIEHRTVAVNGINMHIAEKGEGPVVLFLHGFPELWYSWRHQIVSLAANGYHAVAPDLRGYGDTDAPSPISSYTCFHIVGDLIALIDTLGVQQVFLVGHDWGALIAWFLAMFRPDKVKALVTLSVPFLARNPQIQTVELFHSVYGDDYYISRFQEPGVIEAEMAASGTARVMTKFFTSIDPGPLLIPKGWFSDSNSPPITLPSWLSQEDVDYFASKFDKKGFTGPLNYYRNLDLNWELMAPWAAAQVKVPAKFVIGERDLVYNIQFMKEYIHSDAFKKNVPLLEEVVVVAGAGHFINQEIPSEINAHLFKFFQKF